MLLTRAMLMIIYLAKTNTINKTQASKEIGLELNAEKTRIRGFLGCAV
jgi:hypothetical protein